MDSRTEDPTAPAPAAPARERLAEEPVTDEQSPTDAFADAKTRLSELAEYISYYFSAKFDGVKVSVRNLGIYAAVGVIGLIAASALVTTAVVFVCIGIAGGLSALFGDRLWQGTLVAGLLVLALLGAGVWFGISRMTRSSRERTVRKYAARQQQQRAKFGHDVNERADEPAK